jgi:hypothetical protein
VLRSPTRRLVITSAVALTGTVGAVLGVAALSSAQQDEHRSSRPAGIALLEAEIDALVAGGIEEGHPKLEMLQDELTELEAGMRADPPPEPGVDRSAAEGSTGGARRQDHLDRVLDDGPVQCEPIPPDLLTPAEIADATCESTIEPDGSSLYVATGPDGTQHAVRFHPDGTVTRLY